MSTTLLKLACPDRVGLLSRISGFVAEHGGNLVEVHQFTDAEAKWFFTRVAIETGTLRVGIGEFRERFQPLADSLGAEWTIRDAAEKMRVVLMQKGASRCQKRRGEAAGRHQDQAARNGCAYAPGCGCS